MYLHAYCLSIMHKKWIYNPVKTNCYVSDRLVVVMSSTFFLVVLFASGGQTTLLSNFVLIKILDERDQFLKDVSAIEIELAGACREPRLSLWPPFVSFSSPILLETSSIKFIKLFNEE